MESKSTRPRAVRERLRRQSQTTKKYNEQILDDIAILYKKPVAEWDWEELSRGRPRGENGKFSGTKPDWVTPSTLAEAQRRMRNLTESELMTHANHAIAVLVELMTDSDCDDFGKPVVPASVRIDAAKYILNHTIGLPRARVEIEASNPLQELMADVLVNPDDQPSHIVIDGEVIEADEDDGDE